MSTTYYLELTFTIQISKGKIGLFSDSNDEMYNLN